MTQNVKKNKTIISLADDPIAIIGMGCNFPGMEFNLDNIESFENFLLEGLSSIKDVPNGRWDIEKDDCLDRAKLDKLNITKGGFLNQVDFFDADFFNISPAQAKQMDPQQRLFLEVAIRALNHANITISSLNGSNTGVYCGISTHDYNQLNFKDNIDFNAYTSVGIASSAATGRLSNFLNLSGPCMVIDTACSSSLSALYTAAKALANNECQQAIVGGVHLNLCPENFIANSKAQMLSASGKCSSFDSKADGFARSEGGGVIIIKRLTDALKDNNKILAVLKSIVMNQDGSAASLVAPNIKAQVALHKQVLQEASLAAKDVNYIETHGTGTQLGDEIEFNAITKVHQGEHSDLKPLIIGALKSNLGHTLSSSGIASLIKAICVLNSEVIPANLHFEKPNKKIKPQLIPAILPLKNIDYKKNRTKKRYAQILNFGFTGTNVSAIIEEAEITDKKNKVQDNSLNYFVASANSKKSLSFLLKKYQVFLERTDKSLADVCFTLINCRDHYKYRTILSVKNKTELLQKIKNNDLDIIKVKVNNTLEMVESNSELITKKYIDGCNIFIKNNNELYNKVELPLYVFDKKPYWHAARNDLSKSKWLDELCFKPKEKQMQIIMAKLEESIKLILGIDLVHNNVDFEELGFNDSSLINLDKVIKELFESRCKVPSVLASQHFTLTKLAIYCHQMLMPESVMIQLQFKVLNIEPIAIIGMSCRFPKAHDLDSFFKLLKNGQSGMTGIPLERWDNEKYYDSDVNALGRLYIKQLGLIDNVKNFDAKFFNLSNREAKLMAPQLRVFLEESYHAIEHANLILKSIKGSNTGVFVGCGTNEYPAILDKLGASLEDRDIYFATGNVLNALPGRVAYSFDFHGPIQAIDTACSSSMTAIHNACLSLQAGDCDMALAGGINILLNPDSNVTLSKAKMLSPTNRCKTFSDDADGYARSEGCGVIVIKRLSDAIKNKDNILSVIKATSINSDGQSGGFTVPNGGAQEALIRSALVKAKLLPADVDYIEAHGTGTPLADPIEFNTLNNIFSESHSKDKPLFIGAVKTNIGHCESASGVSGFIKAVLSLQNKIIFKHLNFTKLNSGIELKNTQIPLKNIGWLSKNKLRSAGVSSFGFSGANAHVILQEYPVIKAVERVLPEYSLLVISAKSPKSLELLIASYIMFLENTNYEFADICYSALTCRSHFDYRIAIKAATSREAMLALKNNEYKVYQGRDRSDVDLLGFDIKKIQSSYLSGNEIRFSDLYKKLTIDFIKVNLPLYEFDREEHWFGISGKIKNEAVNRDYFFQLQWQAQVCDKTKLKEITSNWLLIGADNLQDKFNKCALPVLINTDEFDTLAGIIFIADLEGFSNNNLTTDLERQKSIIKNLLDLIKKINEKNLILQLVIVGENAIAELLVENKSLNNAALPGFCKTISLELPQYETIYIDVESSINNNFIKNIVNEIKYNHSSAYENIIAYRNGQRLVSRLEKTSITKINKSLIGDGRYLISGGCGGLGLVTAQALLSAGAREIILASRSIDSKALKEQLSKINNFYPGRLIKTVNLDVSNFNEVNKLILELNFDGLLKGIIHAAGAAIKEPLINHKDEYVDYLFDAKVKGAWNLNNASKKCKLDFFIVYSSIASSFGSNKESVYSGANSALDSLISLRRLEGLVGTAVQWGPWGEVGMAAHRSRDANLRGSLISNEQGQAFIKNILHSKLANITIISPRFLKFMLDFTPKNKAAFYTELEMLLIESNSNADSSDWIKFYNDLKMEVKTISCNELLINLSKKILEADDSVELDIESSLFALGFDSIMTSELGGAINQKLAPSIVVPSNIGFDYPTLKQLSKYLELELDKHLNKISLTSNLLDSLANKTKLEQISILNDALCKIAAKILEVDDINQITDGSELYTIGMDSLMALELRSHIHDQLQCPKLSFSIEYFINEPVIENISKNILNEIEIFLVNDKSNKKVNSSKVKTICDIQYVFWALNKLDYSFNIGSPIQLKGKLDKNLLFKAFELAISQHDVLWLSFNKDLPSQFINKNGKFELLYNDLSIRQEKYNLKQNFFNSVMKLMPLSKQPLIRVYLYKVNDSLHELHIILPHIIADDLSCDIIFQSFIKNYQALCCGDKYKYIANDDSFFDYIDSNNRDYSEKLFAKINFWQRYNKDVACLYLGKANHLKDASKQQQFLSHFNINQTKLENFINWHKDNNINVSTGLIAACQIAFYAINRQKKVPIILIHSGRQGGLNKLAMGLFAEYKKINIFLNKNSKFKEFNKSIEKELTLTSPFQKCSHFIKDDGLRAVNISLVEYIIYLLDKSKVIKRFSKAKVNSKIISYYLKYLSKMKATKIKLNIKQRINKLFCLNLSLLKPSQLRVVISITPSFFIKEFKDQKFSELEYSYPSHYACMDRSIGNNTLWLYFTVDNRGVYQLSINGPLTLDCKKNIAAKVNDIISKVENFNDYNIKELL